MPLVNGCTDADFTRFLIDRGLTAAGLTETMEHLRQRYGRRSWFKFQDVIELPRASLFPEQTEPFFFLYDRNCLVPPTELECDFDYHRDAHQTHALALDRLTALFGTPEKGQAVNTIEETWTFERMSLRIRTFLKEKNPHRNPLYERNPQLWNFCRISIDLNWVQPRTEADAALLSSLAPNEILPIESFLSGERTDLSRWERGLFRLAQSASSSPSNEARFLWKKAGYAGWSAHPWAAFFERRRCIELRLEQVQAARSAGYSRLLLSLHNPFTLKQEPDNTVVLDGKDTHTLDGVAPGVAAFWELPLKIEKFDAD